MVSCRKLGLASVQLCDYKQFNQPLSTSVTPSEHGIITVTALKVMVALE